MTNINKRGQITIFMILGLVMIAVFAFVIYSSTAVQRIQLQKQAEKVATDILGTTALEYYVTLCTKEAMEDGLDLIGKQGGRILPEQGGNLPSGFRTLPFEIESKTYQATYGIINSDGIITLPPLYPCFASENFPPEYCRFINNPSIFPTYKYFFGFSSLPPLCKTSKDCAYEASWGPFSIQEQLEYFIANRTKECVSLESIVGLNESYNVTEGDVSVNLSISDSSLTAIINFPIVVTFKQAKPVVTFTRFETVSPARLKRIYKFAKDIVDKDVSDLNFNIINDSNRTAYYYGDLAIQRMKNIVGFDDLLRITDQRFVSGQQFLFQFMIENRPPVLDYISTFGEPSKDSCNSPYDIFVFENRTLLIAPQAYDPDDDAVSYSYSGWKANYIENLTSVTSYFLGQTRCSLASYEWRALSRNLWHSSPEYVDTNRIASVEVNRSDSGFHNFTVTAASEGYSDWQIVRVLVDDMPEVKANITGYYPDMPNDFSVEDPFTLKSDINDYFNAQNYLFEWRLDNSNDAFYSTDKNKVTLPENADILTIRDWMTSNGISPGQHNFKLRAVSELDPRFFQESNVTINFKSCLPYRSNIPIFPYSSGDPFMANHTSCISSYNYNNGAQCYKEETYGSYKSFDATRYNKEPLPSDKTPLLPSTPSNSIFKRIFTRSCSADRGNVCGGTANDGINSIDNCGGITNECKGPPKNFLKPETPESSSAIACANYEPGQTFTAINANPYLTSYNALCNPAFARSDITYNDNKGFFAAQGQCNLLGACGLPVNKKCAYGSPACNGELWYMLPKYVTTCDPSNNRKYYCDGNCNAIINSGSTCSSIGSQGCTADAVCNNQLPGYKLSTNDIGKGCNSTCKVKSCGLYEFKPTDDCYTNFCVINAGYDSTTSSCVLCVMPKNGIQSDGTCEQACGAGVQCDEKVPGSTFIAGTCIGCTYSGMSCGEYNTEFAIVCTPPIPAGAPDAGKDYELRIQRKSAVGTCGTVMSGFTLTYSAGQYYMRYQFSTTPISKGMNYNKQINTCMFDVEFKV